MLGVRPGEAAFAADLGLAHKPTFVRLRFDPQVLGFPAGITEASLRTTELARAREVWRKNFCQVPGDPAVKAPQTRSLAGRGFGAETARRVLAGGYDEDA